MQTQYALGTGSPRLDRAIAEQSLVEATLQRQVSPPLDAPLRLVNVQLPPYPAAIRQGSSPRQGNVRVSFTVSADGSISNATIVGQPDPLLAAICIDSVLRWKFAPISRNGAPTSQRLNYEFQFKLE